MKKAKKTLKKAHKSQVKQVKKTDKSIEIMGVTIFGTLKSEVLSRIWLQRKEMLHVATVNSEYIMEARTNEKFSQVLGKCLTVADGYGVVWASQILQSHMTNSQIRSVERITGVELSQEILKHANVGREKVFLLGGAPGVAEKAAQEMSKKYPGVQISWYEGAKMVAIEKNEEASITIAKINACEPDYLLVAYGSPYQDLWIEENRPYLRVRVAMGVGGTLDEWAGRVKLCPLWIDQLGFKWLWRVFHEPWRFNRIIKVFKFGFLVLWMKLKEMI
ncbi:WecB/TagA/CpsF family glycosyltransferase [Candidatus Woesebacteria bacterium]|nr:WecB/TagA/CpsF family glycosyltransferase [Candidatus Woesebacteria bacterium]